MKKIVWSLGLLIVLISGCLKKSTDTQTCNYPDSQLVVPINEIDSVQKYLTDNGLTATQHPSGFFYKITSTGTGASIANLCTVISVKYKGRLTNGNVFDSTALVPISFQLGRVIPGWQKGMPLISSSGKIRLYIPPTLGYGNRDIRNNAGEIIIPKKSILIFDIELVAVG